MKELRKTHFRDATDPKVVSRLSSPLSSSSVSVRDAVRRLVVDLYIVSDRRHVAVIARTRSGPGIGFGSPIRFLVTERTESFWDWMKIRREVAAKVSFDDFPGTDDTRGA